MKKYKIKIEPVALADIQEITDWYNEQQAGVGKNFQASVIKHINSLSNIPQGYPIRYKEIRCAPIHKFPYMIHFFINDETNTVEVLAVINTSRNPKIWDQKTSKQ